MVCGALIPHFWAQACAEISAGAFLSDKHIIVFAGMNERTFQLYQRINSWHALLSKDEAPDDIADPVVIRGLLQSKLTVPEALQVLNIIDWEETNTAWNEFYTAGASTKLDSLIKKFYDRLRSHLGKLSVKETTKKRVIEHDVQDKRTKIQNNQMTVEQLALLVAYGEKLPSAEELLKRYEDQKKGGKY